jgi:hypothetical protein
MLMRPIDLTFMLCGAVLVLVLVLVLVSESNQIKSNQIKSNQSELIMASRLESI